MEMQATALKNLPILCSLFITSLSAHGKILRGVVCCLLPFPPAMGLPRLRTLRGAGARSAGKLLPYHGVGLGFLLHLYLYTATSRSSTPSLRMSDLPNQAPASPSHQPHVISSKKRKKQHLTSHARHGKAPKPGSSISKAASEGTDEYEVEAEIPDGFAQSGHTERRRRSANAWEELMPSLIHPLMAALHNMAPQSADRAMEVETFACESGCNVRRSAVKNISFGGM